jgi:hypothetical protein
MHTKRPVRNRFIKNNFVYLLAVCALFTGGAIYLLWRQDTLLYFAWLDAIRLSAPAETVRAYCVPLYPYIPDWTVYSLPNGLWAFSYALFISYLWRDNRTSVRYLWYASVPVLCIGWELLQYTGTIPGVFCYNDLSVSAAGVCIGMFLGLNYQREKT